MPIKKGLTYLLGGCLLAICACSPSPAAYKPEVSFAEAITHGDEQAVQYYLKEGESPNQLDEQNTPLLLLAAQNGNAHLIKMLLDANAFTDLTNAHGETALWMAANSGNEDAVKVLLNAGADPNTTNSDQITPLMTASEQGYMLVVEYLIDAGADVKLKNKDNKTAQDLAEERLQQVAEDGSLEDVEIYDEITWMLEQASKPLVPTLVKSISTSDAETIEKFASRIKALDAKTKAKLLFIASQVGAPQLKSACYVDAQGNPQADFPCMKKDAHFDSQANAQIINMLLDTGADSTAVISFDKNDNNQFKQSILTVADNLQKANPELLNAISPRLDKCMLALAGMQQANPKNEEDWVYADYWRESNCSMEKMNVLGALDGDYWPNDIWPLERKELDKFYEIGMRKEALQNKLGEPNFIEHPNEFREVLTYRNSVPTASNRDKIDIRDDIYVLDRGVVTHRSHKYVANGLRPYVDSAKIAKFENAKGY